MLAKDFITSSETSSITDSNFMLFKWFHTKVIDFKKYAYRLVKALYEFDYSKHECRWTKNIYISQINGAHVLLYTHAGVAESIK